ncbi:hypothetical protein LNO81_03505 [Klebsiella variicola subsp. variicola]|nr:hypothetical protein [Klebsiella variicola subsp. variicola]
MVFFVGQGLRRATVMESPVWIPMASKFSIEQTMMQLSFFIAHHFHLVLFPADQ